MVIQVGQHRILMDKEDYDKLRKFSENTIQITTGTDGHYFRAVVRKTVHEKVSTKSGTETVAKTKTFQISRILLDVKSPRKRVTFINGDTLDLRRSNMKVVDRADGIRRRFKSDGKTSQYIGVHWSDHHGKWRAFIKPGPGQKNQLIGSFDEEEEAAKAYNRKAKEYHGPAAVTNELPKKKKKKAA